MTVLLIILSALLMYGIFTVTAVLVLRCPVREIGFSGDDILIKTRPSRLPLRVRMTLRVSDIRSGEGGEVRIKSALPAGGVIRVSAGAKPGCELKASLSDIRAGVMGSPLYRRFGSGFSCVRRLPPSAAVVLSRRDEASSSGAPEGVREFAHGDRLRDLHMKLSAKCGKYMVRERGGSSYAYSLIETKREPVSGKPCPSFEPEDRGSGISAEICAALACLLWLTALRGIFGGLPLYAIAFGALMLTLSALSRVLKKHGLPFAAAFYLLTAAAGIAGAGQLSSQLARAANAVSRVMTARFDYLFLLLQSGRSDPFAVCFLTALTLWAMSALCRSRVVWVRLAGAAVMLAPLLLCKDGYAIPAGIAAVLLALSPWRSFGLKGAVMPALTTAAACAVFTTSFGAYASDAIRLSAEDRLYGGEIAQPCGRVSSVSQPTGDTPALEVLMDSPRAVYLHGFTGCEYKDGSWSAPHSDGLSVTQSDLLSLKESGLSADSQPLALMRQSGAQTQRVTVRRLGADGRYAYITDGADLRSSYPAGLENPAAGSTVSFETLDIFAACESFADAAGSAEGGYLAGAALLDKLYREDFTRIPPSAGRVLAAQLGEVGTVNVTEAAALVREMLKGCEYDPSAAPQTPEDMLQKSRCGNACAYASAAVLAFRYMGVPARYAEGYALDRETAASAAAGSAVTLYAGDFHAWAEYYVEGAGWLPFETVPEYFDRMPHAAGGGEISADGGASAGGELDEAAGSRIYRRLPDEKEPEQNGRTLFIYPAAAAGLVLLYLIYFMLRLELDPLYALAKCAAALRLIPDVSGSYDLSAVTGKTCRRRMERLQKLCIDSLYSPSKPERSGGAAAYLSCLTGRRKL